jgi:starch synthase
MKPRILFASSEMFPLIKTGGLADVSASLPVALADQGHDMVVILPGYQEVLEKASNLKVVGQVSGFMIPDGTQILELPTKQGQPAIWLVRCDECFNRSGGPYTDGYLQEWPDNANRFAVFNRVVYEIAMGNGPTVWVPDLIHCNDWQTGLVPALLSLHDDAPPVVFTIHNLAYQGNFSKETFDALITGLD